jgi:selenocysteine lyase/cysteine desulfurase
VNRHLVWLNNCGTTPTPGPVLDALAAHQRAYAERGIFGGPTESDLHDAVRAPLGRLLGAGVDELALVHHTTEAMTFVSHGLSLAAGDRIVLLENEYPSNVYPWEHWRSRGVTIDFVPLAETAEGFLENLRAALTPTTRVVSLSAVHWCTGLALPLAEVGALCEERGIEFVVDGSQGVGLVPIDVRAMRIGYLAFSAWKWLLGPLGLGVLFVRRDRLARLRFPFKGTCSVVQDEVYLPYREALKPTAARYVLSTPNFNDWIYFDASLAYLERIGFGQVMARIEELARHLGRGLRGLGFTLASDARPERATGIVAARHPHRDAASLVAALHARGVVAAERLGALRLAPHVYNSEAQLDAVVAHLAELVGP